MMLAMPRAFQTVQLYHTFKCHKSVLVSQSIPCPVTPSPNDARHSVFLQIVDCALPHPPKPSIQVEAIRSHTTPVSANQILARLLRLARRGEEHALVARRLLLLTHTARLFPKCQSLDL